MENKKFNQIKQNGFEEFQTISLEYLNHEIEFSQIDRHESRMEREAAKTETRKALLDIYEKNEARGRDQLNYFAEGVKNSSEQNFYSEEYGANFARFNSRDGYELRPNLNKSQKELSQEIENIKSSPREVNFSQRLSTFAQAIGFKNVA